MMSATDLKCPLCTSAETEPYHKDRIREYIECRNCGLVFVPPQYRLSPEEEKRRYDLHKNDPDDSGYRKFLSRLVGPMAEKLPKGSKGLDFGSGPGPALAAMFEERGYRMTLYDPFYADDESVFGRKYDFITATEVVEHLYRPKAELDRLWVCLKEGGWLGIMTKQVRDREAFAGWHYIRDETHIAFYSKTVFRWLGGEWNSEPIFISKDVVLYQK